MNLADLQREAHAIAKEHGWWDQERTFGDLIALVHSELSEALEAYREHGGVVNMFKYRDGTKWFWHDTSGHPVGVASELADVVIRVADMAEWYGIDLQGYRLTAGHRAWSKRESFGEWSGEAHWLLSQAFELAYADTEFHSNERGVNQRLADVILWVERMAAHYGIDLDAAIEAKMEYNKTRPYRHGGKAL